MNKVKELFIQIWKKGGKSALVQHLLEVGELSKTRYRDWGKDFLKMVGGGEPKYFAGDILQNLPSYNDTMKQY